MSSKKILFISKGINSASSRYRGFQFFPYLRANGFDVEHVTASGGIVAILTTLWQASQADKVILLRKTFPFAITWLLRMVSKQLIFDLDDAIFCRSDGGPSKTRMKRFEAISKVSDHIFAGNHFLAQNSLSFTDAVSVIPTCLDVSKYEVNPNQTNDTIDLVWIGSKSTSKYLIDVLPVLEKLAQKHTRLRLKIIADFELNDAKIPVLAIQWNEEIEAKELASSHIGIAPMVDNNWTQGKCALKVLQYMAASLPVVSSNVGVNSEAVIDNETGYLVNTTEEWTIALESLISHQEQCIAMGKAGHQRVRKNYDINVISQRILTILEQ